MSELAFNSVYEALCRAEPTPEGVRSAFDAILAGSWTPVQVGAFLVTLRLRGESAAILRSAALAMRAAMVRVEHGLPRVLDTCGTGGDGAGTLNLSTGAAIIAAAAGVPVGKHGNRAASSRTGSADVLEALGIPVDLPPHAAASLLREVGIAFLFAPTHHPAMKHAGQARRELGVRTIFNGLGPLANPALATHQLVGAYDDALRGVMAEALRDLGTVRAWVVRGVDGLDEISPCGPTRVTELHANQIREFEVRPEEFGFEPCAPADLAGGVATENAAALEAIVSGGVHPAASAVVLNAAAALVVAEAISPMDAARHAREVVRSGAAREKLDAWRQAATRLRAQAPS